MPMAPLYNMKGDKIGEYELPDSIFGVPVNEAVLHEAVVMQLASRRRGTAKTKTIGEVSGGGIKPWRQKGTGRARQGSRRSPLWRGGATLFGPTPRDYAYRLPKKVRRLALLSALSSKAQANEIVVLEGLTFQEPKTKQMAAILKKLDADGKALVVTREPDKNVELSARNLPGVKMLVPSGLNVYDILDHEKLVFTRDAVEAVGEVLSR
ncbi:MAG TPA: 50S ribosomal protein L4 [Firmicutes bacterium]|nr:50S ribosomal protein L4 [Bacillota bacterium]